MEGCHQTDWYTNKTIHPGYTSTKEISFGKLAASVLCWESWTEEPVVVV